ncbi:MAG: hypothetical protein M1822_001948 [Bathelium mastoideum]|nr:MAG: hypothetical protein M1822_001948 [Bathelium mastoideum]
MSSNQQKEDATAERLKQQRFQRDGAVMQELSCQIAQSTRHDPLFRNVDLDGVREFPVGANSKVRAVRTAQPLVVDAI